MYREDASPDRSLLVAAFRGKVFAVDRTTGEQRWKVELSSWSASAVELAIGGDMVLAVSVTQIAFIEYRTGKVVKNVERKERGIGGRPVVVIDGGQLFVGGDGSVACYTLNGEFVWEQYFSGEGTGELALGVPGNVRQADDRGSK